MPAPPARVRYDFVMTFARPQRIRLPLKIVPRSLNELEARAGIEPAHRGFADLGLTTWLPRPERADEQAGVHRSPQAERRFPSPSGGLTAPAARAAFDPERPNRISSQNACAVAEGATPRIVGHSFRHHPRSLPSVSSSVLSSVGSAEEEASA
jgi:hypothetical protein